MPLYCRSCSGNLDAYVAARSLGGYVYELKCHNCGKVKLTGSIPGDLGLPDRTKSSESVQPLRPEAGLCVEVPGEGSGVIVSVKKHGQFFKLHVSLRDGQQVFKMYNPAKMKLSSE